MNFFSQLRLVIASWMLVLACQSPSSNNAYQTDVLVIGGGTSGVTAGIQAARDGADAIIVESTPWLGGMLTAAGVGATDGNHRLPSGLWGEFRQKLYDHYGGPDSVFTGWVSNTQFEPSVGHQMWEELAAAEPRLTRLHGYHLDELLMEGKRVTGATFVNQAQERITVRATITIEATELGDVIAQAGASFRTGMDSPETPHDENIQDLTYVAIVKDYGPGADMTIPEPPNYDPEDFFCLCREVCEVDSADLMDCETVLNYARMPNGKYMLNWPRNGNDYYLNAIPMSWEERQAAYVPAKHKTLGMVYFLQTVAGMKQLGLADDEYPTPDQLPFIPYHREARRVLGHLTLRVEDLVDPYHDADRALYQQAIAVGDYPLDHHHAEKDEVPEEEFPPIPSFSVPYGSLVPQDVEGLLVAEKSISVTHKVNGATRLQPCVMLIGQAAGAAAALCVARDQQPAALDLRELQERLLRADCWLMPYLDITPESPYFIPLQKAGVSGALRGHGVPYQWANQTWIYPDSTVRQRTFVNGLNQLAPQQLTLPTSEEFISLAQAANILRDNDVKLGEAQREAVERWLNKQADPEELLDRKRMAELLVQVFEPFSRSFHLNPPQEAP